MSHKIYYGILEVSKKIDKFQADLKKHQKKLDTIKGHMEGWSSEINKIKPKKSS